MRTCTSLTSSTNQPAPWSSSTLYHSPRRRPRSSANSPLPRAHPIAPFTLLLVLRRSVPDEHEDRRLGDHEVLAPFECDLHRRLAEEQRIVAHARLHRQVLYLGPANLPWLVVHARGPEVKGSEERRSELQSRRRAVCRPLPETTKTRSAQPGGRT